MKSCHCIDSCATGALILPCNSAENPNQDRHLIPPPLQPEEAGFEPRPIDLETVMVIRGQDIFRAMKQLMRFPIDSARSAASAEVFKTNSTTLKS